VPTSRLILASASPRRQSLLREAGYDFVIHPADIDEDAITASRPFTPGELAAYLARLKAEKIAAEFPTDVVLAADTVVALKTQIIGKAIDANHARQILSTLSGTHHQVITGIALARRNPKLFLTETVTSHVQMHPLTPAQIEAYIATNLWQGKAGAYGLQDPHGFVHTTTGCQTNIVGLPMTTTQTLLHQAGINPSRH
jgi:septum formation protein